MLSESLHGLDVSTARDLEVSQIFSRRPCNLMRESLRLSVHAEEMMAKFVTIGYGDRAGYDRTAPNVRAAAHANDDELRRRGALIGVAGPPVQVRNPDAAGVQTEDVAFMSAPLPIAGFAVIEAASLTEAVKLVSGSPCAVAHGVVEVWPLEGS